MAPAHRPAVTAVVQRLCALERPYEASARVGAARLGFRQRWAVLSAAGIYGAIARKVERAGEVALDHRVSTSGAAKLGFVLRGLWGALFTPRAAERPALSRRELAAMAQIRRPGLDPGPLASSTRGPVRSPAVSDQVRDDVSAR